MSKSVLKRILVQSGGGFGVGSPCTKECLADKATQTCLACKRTYKEIAQWNRMTEKEKQEVLAAIRQRT